MCSCLTTRHHACLDFPLPGHGHRQPRRRKQQPASSRGPDGRTESASGQQQQGWAVWKGTHAAALTTTTSGGSGGGGGGGGSSQTAAGAAIMG